MEQNPYESPREPGTLTAGQIVKRGLGVGAILALTPVAVGIAFCASCAAFNAYFDATFPGLEETSPGDMRAWIISAWSVFLLPPAVTVVGMISWALRAYRRRRVLSLPGSKTTNT